MNNDNNYVSDFIMETYYSSSRIPTDAELQRLGIDTSRVFRALKIEPEASFLGKIERIVDRILSREGEQP